MKIRIDSDDNQLDVIDKINVALKQHNLVLVDDELPHDGYCILKLRTIANEEPSS